MAAGYGTCGDAEQQPCCAPDREKPRSLGSSAGWVTCAGRLADSGTHSTNATFIHSRERARRGSEISAEAAPRLCITRLAPAPRRGPSAKPLTAARRGQLCRRRCPQCRRPRARARCCRRSRLRCAGPACLPWDESHRGRGRLRRYHAAATREVGSQTMECGEPRHVVRPHAAAEASPVEEHHAGSTRLAGLSHVHSSGSVLTHTKAGFRQVLA